MFDKMHEIAQAKVDRGIAKLTALTGKGGGLLPTVEDGKALIGTSGAWVPTAIAGGAASASVSDPLNIGFAFAFDPRLAANQQTVAVANRAQFYRVIAGASINKVALDVKATSGNICVSVYANTGIGRAAAPGTRVATTGTVACPAVGYAEIALDATVDVKSGQHWLAISCDNITAQFASAAAATSTRLQQGLAGYAESAFPLPATAPTLVVDGNRTICVVGIPA